MKIIKLPQGKTAYVDDEDYEYLNQFSWYLTSDRRYAMRDQYGEGHRKRKRIAMHREIMGFPAGLVDHIDQNGLNNQRSNLRLATRSDNAKNSKSHKDSFSKYKGVSATNKSYSRISKTTKELKHYVYPDWYVAQICINGRQTYIGTFKTEVEAALAYDKKAKEIFGEFASLNFPEQYCGVINPKIREHFPSPV